MLGGCKTCWGGARMKLGGAHPPRKSASDTRHLHYYALTTKLDRINRKNLSYIIQKTSEGRTDNTAS